MSLYMRSRRATALCESRGLRAHSSATRGVPPRPRLLWPPGVGVSVAARCTGLSRSTMNRYRRDGLPFDAADLVAVRCCHVHPSVLWPEWWLLGDALEVALAEDGAA